MNVVHHTKGRRDEPGTFLTAEHSKGFDKGCVGFGEGSCFKCGSEGKDSGESDEESAAELPFMSSGPLR